VQQAAATPGRKTTDEMCRGDRTQALLETHPTEVVSLGGRVTAGFAHWDPFCGPKRFRLKLGVTLIFYILKTEPMHYTASFSRVGQ